jgi:hypothetical protein
MRILILSLFFMPLSLLAQEYRKCPSFNRDEKWDSQESFVKNQKDVQLLLEWLCSTPPSEQLVERSAAGIFVMEWVTKNPSLRVNVEIGVYSNYLFNEDLMLGYLFGNILYEQKHEGKVKPNMQRVEGLKSLLFLVEHSEMYSKNRVFKSLLRANRKGELNKFDEAMWLTQKK